MIATTLSLGYDYDNKLTISLTLKDKSNIQQLEDLRAYAKDGKPLEVEIKKYRKKRSLDANGYFWKLLGEMAIVLNADKWDIYLKMLKRYGKYTYIAVKPNVVEAVKAQWRETEELGEIEINGQKAIQLLCYFGSSSYDSKEMSALIDGTVSEAKELGVETLTPEEIAKMIALVGN